MAAKPMIERKRFLSWVRGGTDDALTKLLFTGPVLLSENGRPCSIAIQRHSDGKRIEKSLIPEKKRARR